MRKILGFFYAVFCGGLVSALGAAPFTYDGPPKSLSLYIQSLDPTTGRINLTGADSRQPSLPFRFDWGDGKTTDGYFALTHTYADTHKNYRIRVTAHYSATEQDTTDIIVRFVPPQINAVALPPEYHVSVPAVFPPLQSRMPGYGWSPNLSAFGDSFFSQMPRAAIEYVASVAALIEADLANTNFVHPNGSFNQVLLRDASFGGMYSLWFTTPVSFGVGDYGLTNAIQWSYFFHEMGHNVTLNSPANYPYGGKIDGNANAILSETLAQIFQQVAAAQLIDRQGEFGLPDDLVMDIEQSALQSYAWLRNTAAQYLADGKPFESWNDPATPNDETVPTFATLAYQFFQCAHAAKTGYRPPLKRMMHLLQQFNADWHARFSQSANSPGAEAFRATLLVSALSFAFDQDLRQKFRDLNFPIDDAAYAQLLAKAASTDPNQPVSLSIYTAVELEWNTVMGVNYQLQVSTDLTNWANAGGLITGSAGTTNIFCPARRNQKQYFRIRQEY